MEAENNQCNRLLRAFHRFGRLKQFYPQKGDLPRGEFFVLYGIMHCQKREVGDVRISEISRYTHMSMPAVSQILNSLENKGMIERRADRDDRRAVFVSATTKGEMLMKEAMNTAAAMMAEVEERLGKEDTDHFIKTLMRLSDIMDEINNRESIKSKKGEKER